MIILRDTREKQPWDFAWYANQITEIKVQTVKVGDYTLQGYEDSVAIERKRSSGEIAINFGSKRKQFMAEMERMRSYKHKYIVCEFPRDRLDQFPVNSGIPVKDWKYLRMNGGYIRKTVEFIEKEYGAVFLFCLNSYEAQNEVFRIFQEITNG